MSTPCDTSFFDDKGSWFYFNQPINQIEGYVNNVPQILMHGPNKGLLWKTIECAPVVNCISLDTGAQELVIEQSQIIIIRDNGPITDCVNIPLTDCVSSSSSSSTSSGS